MESPTKMKVVWVVTERGERTFWTRVGIGSVNRDGSLTLTLDAFPTGTNRLQVRDYTPRDAEATDEAQTPRRAEARP